MPTTVALIAPGAMGAAIGRRLRAHGLSVRTSLAGRGESSLARARDADLECVDNDRDLVSVDLLLSIVPPAAAEDVAKRMAPRLAEVDNPPVFADCNATSPATVERVAALINPTGAPFVDAAIIGPPPAADGSSGPRLYAVGDHAERLHVLTCDGLTIETLAGQIGAASALKMCYAGLNKGMTALTTLIARAAADNGAGQALRSELEHSLPDVVRRIDHGIPAMLPKAWRWHPEMREIAGFLETSATTADGTAGRRCFESFASLYEQLADEEQRDALSHRLGSIIKD